MAKINEYWYSEYYMQIGIFLEKVLGKTLYPEDLLKYVSITDTIPLIPVDLTKESAEDFEYPGFFDDFQRTIMKSDYTGLNEEEKRMLRLTKIGLIVCGIVYQGYTVDVN